MFEQGYEDGFNGKSYAHPEDELYVAGYSQGVFEWCLIDGS